MDTFSYKVVTQQGKDAKGVIEAETREEAAKKLKDSGYLIMELEKQAPWNKDIELPFLHKKKIKTRDLSVFCRQFSSILKAGVSMIKALEMLSEQTENKILAQALKNVQSNVEKGENLSDSMRQEKGIFPSLLISMVAAGEASGSLETAINRMSIQFEKDDKLKGMVKKAMMYPIVLCFVAIGVVILMLAYVIPNFEDMFSQLESELPFATRLVIMMSDAVLSRWYIILLVVTAVFFAFRTYKATDSGAHVIDRLVLKIPVFGMLSTKTACARFSRTMSTLIQAGMPMMDALDIVAGTMNNVLFRDALHKVRNGVGLGMDMSGQLKATGLFPAMVIHMVSIGEETGNLEEMLTNIANYYDEEVELTTQQATALMEPMIIVVMALLVGGLIAAIYGPMIELYNTLG